MSAVFCLLVDGFVALVDVVAVAVVAAGCWCSRAAVWLVGWLASVLPPGFYAK
jgi:hypothetical protein